MDGFAELIERKRQGSLKVYLGYAAGVGKTYAMLQEGLRLKQQHVDVVIGYLEPHDRPETMALAEHLETVPPREWRVGDAVFHEMDVEAILARKPQVVLVDELAHKAAEKVKGLTQAPTQAVEVEGCDPIRPYYTPRDRHGEPIKDFLKAKPKTDPDKCVKCGLCARLCPMGSIDPNDVSNVVGKCIKCCACVKKCPKGAKYFDHEGYLYHQHELEDQYAGRRAPSKIFL